MKLNTKRGLATLLLVGGLLAAACSSNSSSSTTTTATSSPPTPSSLSTSSFTNTFAAMAGLKGLAAQGKGTVAVILPDTVSSARYAEFDAPYLAKALTTAGLSSSQYSIQNAMGSDTTQLADAQSAIAAGASVLVVDPLDSDVGTSIETYAKAHGVPVIDYDRLTLGGSRQYNVSFDNVKVGTLIGQGMVSCVSSWGVTKPTLAVMVGATTDNNAALFALGNATLLAQGYDAVLKPYFSSGQWVDAANPPGTWDPATAEAEFQQAYTAHPTINAVLVPSDENAAPIITYLKTLHISAKKFPVTGQDATVVGLQNIISGYQCGTVYKPIFMEAQAAAALALYLRAGKTPPASLANSTTQDTASNLAVKSVLLSPEWVTPTNIQSTVIADHFVTAAQLCAAPYSADCKRYGIN